MKSELWLEKIEVNRKDIRNLISGYHPTNLSPRKDDEPLPDSITAPNAERACEVIRNMVRKETLLDCPEAQFDIAISNKDIQKLYSLLSETWFGVPESTDCWRIHGFAVAVDLLDDPPNNMPEE